MSDDLYLPEAEWADGGNDTDSHSLYMLAAQYMLPALATYLLATFLMVKSQGQIVLLQAYIHRTLNGKSTATTDSTELDMQLERQLTLLLPVCYLLYALPLLFLALFTATVWLYINVLLAITFLYVGVGALLLTYTYIRFTSEGWIVTNGVRFSLSILALTTVAYFVGICILATPYTFLSVGIIILLPNTLCLCRFLYLLRSVNVIQYSQYKGFTVSLYDDLTQSTLTPAELQYQRYQQQHLSLLNPQPASSSPSVQSKVRKLGHALLIYVLCLALLGVFVGIMQMLGYGSAAYVCGIALLVSDITVILLLASYCIRTPLSAAIVSASARLLTVCFYENYYFVGHSLWILGVAIWMTQALLNTYMQRVQLKHADTKDVKSLYNQPSNNTAPTTLQPTRIDVAPMSATSSEDDTSLHTLRQMLQHNVRMREHARLEREQSSHQPILTLIAAWVLILSFAADIAFDWYLNQNSNSITAGVSINAAQYFIGLATIYLLYITCAAMIAYRHYVNHHYHLTLKLIGYVTLQYCTIWGFSAAYYLLVEDNGYPLFIFLSVLGYPMVYVMVFAYTHWQRNDYHIILPASRRIPYNASWWYAVWRGGVASSDLYLPAAFALIVALLGAMGYFITPYLAFSGFILLTSIVPTVEWFNAFSWSKHTAVQMTMSFGSYVIGLVLVFVYILDASINNNALTLLLVSLLYPTVLLLGLAAYRYVDEDYTADGTVIWFAFVGSLLTLIDLFILAITIQPWYIAGVGAVIFLLIVCSSVLSSYAKYLSPSTVQTFSTAVSVIILGLCIGVGYYADLPFAGFTLAMVFLVASLTLVSIRHHLDEHHIGSIFSRYIVHYTPHTIFPVYMYDTQFNASSVTSHSAERSALKRANNRPLTVFSIAASVYLYAIVALFFIPITEVGITLMCGSVTVLAIYTFHLRHLAERSATKLQHAVQWLDTETELYTHVLHTAKVDAAYAQLLKNVSVHRSKYQHQKTKHVDSEYDSCDDDDDLLQELAQLATQDIERGFTTWSLLMHKIPSFAYYPLFSTPTIQFQSIRLSRRQAVMLLERLDTQCMQWMIRDTRYLLHMHCSVIQQCSTWRHEYLTQLVQMLREEGDTNTTVKYLLSLSLSDTELVSYEHRYDSYLQQQIQHQQKKAVLRKEQQVATQHRLALKGSGPSALRGSAAAGGDDSTGQTKQQRIAEFVKQQSQPSALLTTALNQLDKQNQQQLHTLQQQQKQATNDLQQQHANSKQQLQQRTSAQVAQFHAQVEAVQVSVAKAEIAVQTLQFTIAEKTETAEERYELEKHRAEMKLTKLQQRKESEQTSVTLKRQRQQLQLQQQIQQLQQQSTGENAIRLQRRQDKDQLIEAKLAELTDVGKPQSAALLKQRWDEQQEKRNARDAERQKQIQTQIAEYEQQLKALQKKGLPAAANGHLVIEPLLAAATERYKADVQQIQTMQQQLSEKTNALEAEKVKLKLLLDEQSEMTQSEDSGAVEQKIAQLQAEHKQQLAQLKQQYEQQQAATRQQYQQKQSQQQQQSVQSLEQQCTAKQCCTRLVSGYSTIVYQAVYRCIGCKLDDLCKMCIQQCHSKHKTELVSECAPTYCECPQCQLMSTVQEREKIQAVQKLHQESPTSLYINPAATILQQCKQQHTKYTDVEFPADDRSLFVNANKPHNAQWKGVKWMRVSELIQKPQSAVSALFTPSANDVQQGKISDCYFLSACSVLTYRPSVFQQIFLLNDYNSEGVYAVRMYVNGRSHTVVIDDYVPVRTDPKDAAKYVPLFAGCPTYSSQWVCLLEKAYAKLYGSYQAIEGGWADSALVDLTGGVPERLSWQDPAVKRMIKDGSLWKTLFSYYEQGFLLGCGSPMGVSDSASDASKWGIVQSHAYAILRLIEVDGIQLLQVRNPWGRFEWQGEYADRDSERWTRRLVAKTGMEIAEDGAFFIQFSDFVQHFDEVYVCRYFDTAKWPTQQTIFGEWRGTSAGGCMKNATVVNNTQYAISIGDTTITQCDVVLELIQEDPRSKGQAGQFPIIVMELYDNNGQRVSQQQRGKMIANKGAANQDVHVQVTLRSNAKPYTLLVCTYQPGIELEYTLKCYATARLKVQQFAGSDQAGDIDAANIGNQDATLRMNASEADTIVQTALQLSTRTDANVIRTSTLPPPARQAPASKPAAKTNAGGLRGSAVPGDDTMITPRISTTKSSYDIEQQKSNEIKMLEHTTLPGSLVVSPYAVDMEKAFNGEI